MNETNETIFENAKVGDKVWTFSNAVLDGEWLEIIFIDSNSPFPIKTKKGDFTWGGQYHTYGPQVIFWGPPTIIPPSRQPRFIEKEIVGYVNVYSDRLHFHHDESGAKARADKSTVLAIAVPVRGTARIKE